MVEVASYDERHLPSTAAIFADGLRTLRGRVPALPADVPDERRAQELLGSFLTPGTTIVALDHGEVVGYLGWIEYPSFRGAPRRGAHSPEFGHAATAGRSVEVFRALYREAAARWTDDGCQIHALTCLAGDSDLERMLFESGFGMLLHDALRPMTPIDMPPPRGMSVRQATTADVAALAELEIEHRHHYCRAAGPHGRARPGLRSGDPAPGDG